MRKYLKSYRSKFILLVLFASVFACWNVKAEEDICADGNCCTNYYFFAEIGTRDHYNTKMQENNGKYIMTNSGFFPSLPSGAIEVSKEYVPLDGSLSSDWTMEKFYKKWAETRNSPKAVEKTAGADGSIKYVIYEDTTSHTSYIFHQGWVRYNSAGDVEASGAGLNFTANMSTADHFKKLANGSVFLPEVGNVQSDHGCSIAVTATNDDFTAYVGRHVTQSDFDKITYFNFNWSTKNFCTAGTTDCKKTVLIPALLKINYTKDGVCEGGKKEEEVDPKPTPEPEPTPEPDEPIIEENPDTSDMNAILVLLVIVGSGVIGYSVYKREKELKGM